MSDERKMTLIGVSGPHRHVSTTPSLQQIPKTGPLAELTKGLFDKHPCDDGCDYAIGVGMPEHHCSIRCMHEEAPDEPRDR